MQIKIFVPSLAHHHPQRGSLVRRRAREIRGRKIHLQLFPYRTCTFFDANDPPGLVDATKSIRVINENRGVSKCSFTSVPNPTNDVITWDYMSTEGFGADGFGLFCCVNADGGAGTLTTDYVQTISPAGESTLTCKFDFDGITGDPFDGSIGKQTTFGCNDVYPQFERCC